MNKFVDLNMSILNFNSLLHLLYDLNLYSLYGPYFQYYYLHNNKRTIHEVGL